MTVRIDHLTLGELRDLADATVLVAAAADAGLLEALHAAPASADEAADLLAYDPRATRIVLQALAETGFVEEAEGRFRLTERGARELGDPRAPGFVGRGLPHWLCSIRGATRLAEVLRLGGPLEKRAPRRSPEDVARFTSAMSAAPPERIRRMVDLCLARCPDARRVLDLGGGPGHVSRAFVERGLRATLFDTPDIVAHVGKAFGLEAVEGLDLVAGDFNRDPLPEGPFDVVLLSNVIHIYGEATVAALFEKGAGVLGPGGVLAVAEFLRGRSHRAAPMGLQMLLRSEAGDTYSADAIGEWLTAAGLTDVEVGALDEDRHLVTAVQGA
jgi:SAM-dependent methyltransferase